jgi:hypothetical protein
VVQLGPLELGVLVVTALVVYAFVRSQELRDAGLGAYRSFLDALKGEPTGPTPG